MHMMCTAPGCGVCSWLPLLEAVDVRGGLRRRRLGMTDFAALPGVRRCWMCRRSTYTVHMNSDGCCARCGCFIAGWLGMVFEVGGAPGETGAHPDNAWDLGFYSLVLFAAQTWQVRSRSRCGRLKGAGRRGLNESRVELLSVSQLTQGFQGSRQLSCQGIRRMSIPPKA